MAWDRKQLLVLILQFLALSTPFFFTGMAVGMLLATTPEAAGNTYAINLLGLAAGCLAAMIAPLKLSGEGTVLLSSGMAALAALLWTLPIKLPLNGKATAHLILASGLLALWLLDLGLRISGQPSISWFDLKLSPYKGLSYALQYPRHKLSSEAGMPSRGWTWCAARDSDSYPGLSYRYLERLPAQDGLLIDGDDLSAVLKPGADMEFASYLPAAIAFQLKPPPRRWYSSRAAGWISAWRWRWEQARFTAVEANARGGPGCPGYLYLAGGAGRARRMIAASCEATRRNST